jgi:hypothetical protein
MVPADRHWTRPSCDLLHEPAVVQHERADLPVAEMVEGVLLAHVVWNTH